MMLELQEEIQEAIDQVHEEVEAAIEMYPAMNGAHEGYAVILEELDELWEEVKKKQKSHDFEAMRKEAKQVAAMAIRFMVDVCSGKE